MRSRAALLLLCLVSCKPAPPGPEGAYQEFLARIGQARAGKATDLLESFDAPSRELLRARAQAASKATGDFMPADPSYQLLQGPAPAAGVAVRVVDHSEVEATLEVSADGGALGQVKMVREDGRWKIHLE